LEEEVAFNDTINLPDESELIIQSLYESLLLPLLNSIFGVAAPLLLFLSIISPGVVITLLSFIVIPLF